MAESLTKESSVKKVIFCDFAVVKFNSVINWLRNENVVAEAVTDVPKLLAALSEQHFDVAVVNLVLGGVGPVELISNVRSASSHRDIRIIVTSRQNHKANINNCIRAGASDFVAEPFEPENLHNRILYHLTPKKVIEPKGYEKSLAGPETWPFINLLLESMELLCSTERSKEYATFYKILSDVAKLLGSNRTSLIVVDAETDSGVVLASSDDPKFVDFPISLHKYPEILHVMHTGYFVLIEDVTQNQMTQKINESVRTIAIGSLMVFPIRFAGDVIAVLTCRRAKAKELPLMDTLRVLQALATTLAAHANIKALLRRIYKDYNPTPAGSAPPATPVPKAG
jgi:CheY-like chemotaxis protein